MNGSILAFDYGAARIGLALCSPVARLANPLTTVVNDKDALNKIAQIISDNLVTQLVVGLPRSLDGNDTAQTLEARDFANKLEAATQLPIALVDEALSSVEAEERLRSRAKQYKKEDIDSEAAAIILEDYLSSSGVNS